MMLQIGHRESHDVDLFLDDPQILGFLDPSKSDLEFAIMPSDYVGDGARFQKFAFSDIGEIDFIVAGSLTDRPFIETDIEGYAVKLETIGEIIAKKVYHRGRDAKARDIFDMAAAARTRRPELIESLRPYPDQAGSMARAVKGLNPDFVSSTIGQLMIRPEYSDLISSSAGIVSGLLDEVLSRA